MSAPGPTLARMSHRDHRPDNVRPVQVQLEDGLGSTAGAEHASTKTTLDTYGHLWPDSDESTRTVVEAVMANRADHLRTAEGR